jgi:DNA polymerase-3 subunit delta'
MADNAPLRALNYAEQGMHQQFSKVLQDFSDLAGAHANPVEVANRWSNLNPTQVCFWLTTWVSGVIRLKSATTAADNHQQAVFRELPATTDLKGLFLFLDRLKEAIRALEGQANKQLVIEDLLAVWWRLNGGRA